MKGWATKRNMSYGKNKCIFRQFSPRTLRIEHPAVKGDVVRVVEREVTSRASDK